MRRGLWHRIWHGHWPLYRFVPVSDYLEWRTCRRCLEEKRDSRASR